MKECETQNLMFNYSNLYGSYYCYVWKFNENPVNKNGFCYVWLSILVKENAQKYIYYKWWFQMNNENIGVR